jgi:hypothetical protein
MTQEEPTAQEFEEDGFVTALVPDPSELPDARFLSGFLGRGSQEGYWRLYVAADLQQYVEFSAEDVLHSQPMSSSANALGGHAIWVKRTATIEHSAAETEAQAGFLRGDVAAAFAAGPARARQAGIGRMAAVGPMGDAGLAADPTLFRAHTCALSSCISDVAICTNTGQATCDPVFCVAAPVVVR